jgi:lysophospholipase L1-like esterase
MYQTGKKILFSLILTGLGLFLLNVCSALGERLAYGAFWGDERPKGLYIHKNGERPRLKPGANLDGLLYQISVNSLGFRGPEISEKRPQNALRVWCIGGSTTFDIFSPDDASTWPMRLQAKLADRFPSKVVEVLNAGIPGEIYWGSRSDFEQKYSMVKPDYVVLYHGPNDIRQISSSPHHAAGSHNTPTIGPNDGLLHSLLSRQDIALIRVLRRSLQPIEALQPHWEGSKLTNNGLGELRNRVLQFIQSARQRRATPVLASHALRAADGDTGDTARARIAESAQILQMYPEAVIESFRQYNGMMADLAKQQKLPFTDIRAAVDPSPENWGDATHFLAPGSDKAAEAVAGTIAAHLGNGR